MSTLTRNEIVAAIRGAVATGESVNSCALSDRLCRSDAVGRLSKRDGEYFDLVLAEMVADGEITQRGPFISGCSRSV